MFPTFPVFLPSPAQVTNPILLWLLIHGGDPSFRATLNGQFGILTAVHGLVEHVLDPDIKKKLQVAVGAGIQHLGGKLGG